MELQSGWDMDQVTMNRVTGTLKVRQSSTKHASAVTAIVVTKSGFAVRALLLFDSLKLQLFLKQSVQLDEKGRIRIF